MCRTSKSLCSFGLALRLDRQPLHRLRKLEGLQEDLILVMRVVQYAIEFDLVDLGNGTDVARNEGLHLDIFLALRR